MEVSPKVLRDVEFREARKGYHPDDVDEFLEKVAVSLDMLQQRLRQTVDRAERAESAAQARSEEMPAEAGDVIGRTLVMAQRTADQAVADARRQAAEVIENANLQADAVVSDATEVSVRMKADAEAEVRAELNRLEAARNNLQADVDSLERHLDGERSRLQAALADTLRWLDGNMTAMPPPAITYVAASDPPAGGSSESRSNPGPDAGYEEGWESRSTSTVQAQGPSGDTDWSAQENRSSSMEESGRNWRS
ncbi:MAG: DivIVA domain-containing protein [Acidimicrobiales bacterium]